MGSGWHEWPLMIFTVFGQCVAGGFIVLALALLKGDLRAEAQQRVIACMFGLWVLMGIGFIASMLHLGSPMRAFNSLNRVGASALSNEIASGSIFCCWWHRLVTGNAEKLSPALRTLWLVVTMVLGVIFVWMMVRVYNSIDTVPTRTASDADGLLPDDVYGRPVTGLPVVESGWRRWLGDASAASNFCTGTGSEWRDVSDAGRRAGDYS